MAVVYGRRGRLITHVMKVKMAMLVCDLVAILSRLYHAYIYTLIPLEPAATLEQARVLTPNVEAMAAFNCVYPGIAPTSKIIKVIA